MERIGVRHLQQNASAVVRRAQRGERIEVTDRGRPVAILSPATGASQLDVLEAAGRLVRGEGDLLSIDPIALPRRAQRPSRRLAKLRAGER